MMTSYFRIGGLAADVPDELVEGLEALVRDMPRRIDDYEMLLSKHPIFMDRRRGVGVMSREDALRYGFTGPCLRGTGIPLDIRKVYPYCGYEQYEFDVPYSNECDVYARYMVRMREMRESVRILEQSVRKLRETKGAPVKIDNPKIIFPKREKIHKSMESLIHHFKLVSEGPVPPSGEAYAAIESPRGEQATYIFSDGSNKPYRVRFRAPGFFNLQALPRTTNAGLG